MSNDYLAKRLYPVVVKKLKEKAEARGPIQSEYELLLIETQASKLSIDMATKLRALNFGWPGGISGITKYYTIFEVAPQFGLHISESDFEKQEDT